MPYTVAKLLSVLFGALMFVLPEMIFYPLFIGMTIMHFYLGHHYGMPLLKQSFKHRPLTVVGLALATVGSFALIKDVPTSFLLFGTHIIMTETFWGMPGSESPKLGPLKISRWFFETLVFLCFSYRNLFIEDHQAAWGGALACSFFIYCYFLFTAPNLINRERRWDLFGTQLISLLYVVIYYSFSPQSDIRAYFTYAIVHGTVHVFFPIARDRFRPNYATVQEFTINSLVTLLGGVSLVYLIKFYPEHFNLAMQVYFFMAYYHLYFTLASSRANPKIIRDFFKIRPVPLRT